MHCPVYSQIIKPLIVRTNEAWNVRNVNVLDDSTKSIISYRVISLVFRRHALASLLVDKDGYQTDLNRNFQLRTGS